MVEVTFEMPDGYQLEETTGTDNRTLWLLKRYGEIVLVMKEKDPDRINKVIAQIEAGGAIPKTG